MHKLPKKLRAKKRAERMRVRKLLYDDAIIIYKTPVRCPARRIVNMIK